MGMDLSGSQGDFQLNMFAWENVLRLARMHGWEPAGTLPPLPSGKDEGSGRVRFKEWDPTNYYTNDGQRTTAEDARNLADALEQALADVPSHDALGHKSVSIELPGGEKTRAIPADADVSPLEYFSGKGKKTLVEFIAFCRTGGFSIW